MPWAVFLADVVGRPSGQCRRTVCGHAALCRGTLHHWRSAHAGVQWTGALTVFFLYSLRARCLHCGFIFWWLAVVNMRHTGLYAIKACAVDVLCYVDRIFRRRLSALERVSSSSCLFVLSVYFWFYSLVFIMPLPNVGGIVVLSCCVCPCVRMCARVFVRLCIPKHC